MIFENLTQSEIQAQLSEIRELLNLARNANDVIGIYQYEQIEKELELQLKEV